jgi:uncharacterized protein GlcG (DUF336 family)
MSNLTEAKQLTLAGARAMGLAAEAEAIKNGWSIAVAIVDAGGHPLYLARMERALLASYRGALKKASTAVMFGRTTKRMEDDVARGRLHFFAFEDVLPVEGGVPLVVDGQTVGGLGIGGTTSSANTVRCVEAALAAFSEHNG